MVAAVEMICLKNLVAAPPRLQRMLLKLPSDKIWLLLIVYKPGREMSLPNGLSRLPNKNSSDPMQFDIKVNFVQFRENKLQQLKQETSMDGELVTLMNIIRDGWPDKPRELPAKIRT